MDARLAVAFSERADSMTDSGISIELNRTQIDHVVREASEDAGVSGLLRGLTDRGALASKYRALSESPRLSRSLLLGLLVLACFPSDGDSLAVSDVAERLDMSPSTTHRYMTTLLAVGLLEQDPRTRRYSIPVSG
jgi:DNA-binding transcriptional ArsR family regulator